MTKPQSTLHTMQRPTTASSVELNRQDVYRPFETSATLPRLYQASIQTKMQVRANEIRGWLDNLLLMYENQIARNSTGLAWTRPRGSGAFAPTAPKANIVIEKKPRGRPKKIVTNRLKPFLKNFVFPRQALKFLPMFDDIVTGAVRLDAGGNDRPLSKTMMVSLLQVLDEVSTEAIQTTKGYSKRHSQRICQCLRIIESMAFKVAHKHWHPSTETDWSDAD